MSLRRCVRFCSVAFGISSAFRRIRKLNDFEITAGASALPRATRFDFLAKFGFDTAENEPR